MNATGIAPTEFKCLVLPDEVEEKVGSIFLPEQKKESDKYAQTKGTLIARSPLAFSYASAKEWEENGARKPDAGDRILYSKYAGFRVTGDDGKEYLMINDKDICALVE